jgi:DNA-binding LytR/AlgR family response regulator
MADLATIEKAKLANPYAYLVKPIQPETLLSTIEISLYNAQIKREIAKQEPIAITNTALGIGDNIFVKSKKRLEKIKVADILWIQADDIYSIIITATGKYILSQALKNLEDKFPAEFMRVHRSYIVQLDKIQAIEDNDLIIKDNYIPIGKTYRDRLMAKLSFF